ncbi:hypothetical protein [Oceanicola sp. 502str15]|uniref:hypothetical protein n=1 Tax=Oceanicola sp. 502str15 TaxID=2696061 RepID=UPI002094875C|nr:hypothetical protein [Oceanicola sp. 502str15]MCO6381943.1 hypothetical protein [Oceanicola sp. 502str15]
MSQQDFQQRLARLNTQPEPAAAPMARASAPSAPARRPREPGPLDVALGLLVGVVANLIASIVEFHLWLGGDAMAYITGEGSFIGSVAVFAAAYLLITTFSVKGFPGMGGVVAGVFGMGLLESFLPEVAPGLATALFNDQYVSLILAGYDLSFF